MRVLVTGASGFVGSAVSRQLLAEHHEVVGLVRDPGRAAALRDLGVSLERGDMLEPSTYVPLVADVDAVVHTAQYAVSGRLTRKAVDQIAHGDHVMTAALADACLASGRRLVYTSGCFNYGDHGSDWIEKTTPFTPSPLGEAHSAEVTRLRERHAQEGLDVIVISPGFVYGPGGLFKSAFTDQAQAGRLRVIGPGTNYWSCVHVQDLARAYVAGLAHAPAGGEYNAVDDEPLTLRSLVDAVTDGMGRKRVGRIPPRVMGVLIGGPLVQSLVTSFRIRNARARDELGWAPTYPTFRDGLPTVLADLGVVA